MTIDDLVLPASEYKTVWLEERYDAGVIRSPSPLLIECLTGIMAEARGKVLEIGCGTGRNTKFVVQAGFDAVGLDLSLSALQALVDDARTWSELPTVLCGDLESLDQLFPEACFDAVLCLDMLGHVRDIREAVRGLNRVLRPGGLAYVNLYTLSDDLFARGDRVGSQSFIHEGILTRFFDRADALELFELFNVEMISTKTWAEPAHLGQSYGVHTHDSMLVTIRKPHGN